MKLKKAIDRIPGGLMLVPLLLGACVHTFAPGGGKYLGSFTNGLIYRHRADSGGVVLLHGRDDRPAGDRRVLRKSGTLLVTKMLWRGSRQSSLALHSGDGVKAGLLPASRCSRSLRRWT
jgi:2-keto-3-deoxygluconate permease.